MYGHLLFAEGSALDHDSSTYASFVDGIKDMPKYPRIFLLLGDGLKPPYSYSLPSE